MIVTHDSSNELVGVRVVGVSECCLFDAANFVDFSKKSQIAAACNINTLKLMIDLHPEIEYFNTGLASGTLKKNKQHFQNTEVFVYRANKKPETDNIVVLF